MQTVPAGDEKFIPEYVQTYNDVVADFLVRKGSSLLNAEIGTETWLIDGAEAELLKRFRDGLQARLEAGQNQESIAEDLAVVQRTSVTKILSERGGLSTKSLTAIKIAYNVPFPSHKELIASGTVHVVLMLFKELVGGSSIFDVECFWCLHRLFNSSEWPAARKNWSKSHQETDRVKLEAIATGLLDEVTAIIGRPLRMKNADDLIRLATVWGELYLVAIHLVYRKLSRDRRAK